MTLFTLAMSNFSVDCRVLAHHPADGGQRQLLIPKTPRNPRI
jgi:hypothetical protein